MTTVTIDNKEYVLEDLNQEQQILFKHCIDLDQKIDSSKFQLDQLSVCKQGFYNMLKESLKES